jgi:hypothetical protein
MIPLFTQEEFDSVKSRQKLPLQCKHCGKTFHRTKHDIQIGNIRRGTMDFCSISCTSRYHAAGHRLSLTCEQCGNHFSKILSQVKVTKHHFCSKSCAAKYRNSHKTTGFRRSKLEAWLETQLTSLHPELEFHFNRKDTIDSELDIYIPSLKLAFELNGIFHFEPIFGTHKLNQIQSNDQRKFLACAERGISLCILDVSHIKYFKDRTSKPFLDIIERIISQVRAGQ